MPESPMKFEKMCHDVASGPQAVVLRRVWTSFPHRVISVMFVIRITPPLITHYLRPTNQSYRWHASGTNEYDESEIISNLMKI